MIREYFIGDFLKRIKRPIELENQEEYKLVTIKMNHNGVILREMKKGSEIKSNMYSVNTGDFILSGIDARNGAFGIIPKELNEAIVTNDFWYFEINENIILKELFLELTETSWFDEICKRGSDGTTQRIRLQKDKFFNQKILIPEKSEQKAILDKIKHFKQSLECLNRENISQKNNINNLRISILQGAIQGKLTAEWRKNNPNIEPAVELLKRIKVEKELLVKTKKLKQDKPLPSITKEEIPFELPDGWVWCRLGEITFLKSGNQYNYPNSKEGVMFVKVADMNIPENKYEIKLSSNYFNIEFVKKTDLIPTRSIIFPKRGGAIATNKRRAVLQEPILADSNTMAIIPSQEVDFNFFFHWFSTIDLNKFGNDSVIPQVNNKDIYPLQFPLPPFSEQKAIVEKVEALLEKCSQLQSEIENQNRYSKDLLQTLFNETFGGGND